ncbi:alpha-L-fucosidase [Neolewinella aurantiaca]|nr:alpha-L-fucosidase [Neolewinella aurantiaca]
MRYCLSLLLVLSLASRVSAQTEYTPEWEALKKHQAAPGWFADAKFGVYFHWGVYSVPAWGGEWYPRWMYVPDRVGWGEKIYGYHQETYGNDFHYHDFIPLWKGAQFDAREWVDAFAGSGAKIIGAIAEHHDGFSLWDSKVNPWNSARMGPKVNVVKAIQDEAKARDLKFMTTFHHGFNLMFYPKPENSWTRRSSNLNIVQDECKVPQDPQYRKLYGLMNNDEANDFWLAKLDEVINEYVPDYIWMDFGQRFIEENHRKRFLANYFNRAAEAGKDVVVNTKGDFFPQDLAIVNIERATMADIQPEVWVTDFILGSAWSYDKTRRTAIDPAKAIRILAEVVSKNGVMLLSAGPTPEGTIPEEQLATLKAMGEWLGVNGEAIYGTRPFVSYGEGTTLLTNDDSDAWKEFGALKKGIWDLNAGDVRYTQNGKTLYAIQLGWAEGQDGRLLSVFGKEAKGMKVRRVSVLGSEERITYQRTPMGLTVNMPREKPAHADMALVWRIELE